MSKAIEYARASFIGVEGYAIHNRRMFGNKRTYVCDVEQRRNERVNRLWIRYTETLNVLRAKIADYVKDGVERCECPKRVAKLAGRCIELRTRREMVLQGNLPKRTYKLVKPERVPYELF